MLIKLHKYHGAGNDFILIKGDHSRRDLSSDEISFLCHRQFGIGADGVIFMTNESDQFYLMQYFNADGSQGMMCANGARCAVRFAEIEFGARHRVAFSCCGVDYSGVIEGDDITIGFPDLVIGRPILDGFMLDTGAPHYVQFIDDEDDPDFFIEGRRIRYHEAFQPEGVNANFVVRHEDLKMNITTYERGVEDLTLACGTGAVAAAIATSQITETMGSQSYHLESEGGNLVVSFLREQEAIRHVYLKGPAVHVFTTTMDL